MEYNPANLAYAEDASLSFFRNPFESWAGNIPLSSLALATKIEDFGSIGLEYTDYGFDMVSAVIDTTPQGYRDITMHFYTRTFAAGYATHLGDELAVGAQIRYSKQVAWQITLDHLLFSAGATYSPEVFSNRLNIGISLMNFGTKVEYQESVWNPDSGRVVSQTLSAPSPAQLIVGIEGLPIANEFFELELTAGAMKPLDKVGSAPDFEAESSFEALFNDWNNFPNDVTGRLGLGYVWHPIYLGGGISYIQEMYAGFFTEGPKPRYYSAYTHGFNVGIEAGGIKAMVGYAGLWHNSIENYLNSPFDWDYPWETFQFTLSADPNLLMGNSIETQRQNSPSNIIVSGGYSYNVVVGKMEKQSLSWADTGNYWANFGSSSDSYSSYSEFSIEGDIYLNSDEAIVSSFSYSRIKQTPTDWTETSPYPIVSYIRDETFSLSSGFRYHPIEDLHPLFIQASIGVIRLNPIEDTSPKYFYQTITDLSIGGVFHIVDPNFTVIPSVGLKTIFMDAFGVFYGPTYKLAGYNQIRLGLNLGYEF